ncbi:hypothetical protein ABT160_06240 [Streptomyces sp. NPDC001941]|uniref:hypothetical protein n=1 Tax=Streptomyces sp. NPDC001941 TaxID=3154659 RepID=UPI003320CFA5
MNRLNTWARDLSMGARFAVTGGRQGWTRTLLTALGAGLGIAVLLVAASVPQIQQHRGDRTDARAVYTGGDEAPRSDHSFRYVEAHTVFRGETVNGTVVGAAGAPPPPPPRPAPPPPPPPR